MSILSCACIETLSVCVNTNYHWNWKSFCGHRLHTSVSQNCTRIRRLLKKSSPDYENFKNFRRVHVFRLFLKSLRKLSAFSLPTILKLITWVKPIVRLIRVLTARKQPYLEFIMIFWERLITTDLLPCYYLISWLPLIESTMEFCYIVLNSALVLKAVPLVTREQKTSGA